jgi:hypothetical protein
MVKTQCLCLSVLSLSCSLARSLARALSLSLPPSLPPIYLLFLNPPSLPLSPSPPPPVPLHRVCWRHLGKQLKVEFSFFFYATKRDSENIIDCKKRRLTRFLNRFLLHFINILLLTAKRDSLLGIGRLRLGFPHVYDNGQCHTTSSVQNPLTHSSPSPSDLFL